jgi:hypothetical protein
VQSAAAEFKGWLLLCCLDCGGQGWSLLCGNALGHATRVPEHSPPRGPYWVGMHISVARWSELPNGQPHLLFHPQVALIMRPACISVHHGPGGRPRYGENAVLRITSCHREP